MKNCPNCGLEMDDRARFCSLCGFEFKGQGRHSAFGDNKDHGQTEERNIQADERHYNAGHTEAFSATDDTIYFNNYNSYNFCRAFICSKSFGCAIRKG